MFGLFKKKDPIDELSKKYKKLLEESYQLSTTNRSASDIKRGEAERVMDEIEKLRAQK